MHHPKAPELQPLYPNIVNKLPKAQDDRVRHNLADAQRSTAKEINFPSLHEVLGKCC